MPPAEASMANSFKSRMSTYDTSPLKHFENFFGINRYEPINKIGFQDGVKNLATKTRGFFSGFFSPNKKK